MADGKREITGTSAIREYFSAGGDQYRKVEIREIKECSSEDRQELGRLAAEALGCKLIGAGAK